MLFRSVRDIYSLLEKYGVITLEKDYDVDVFDGVSFMTDKGYYVIIINSNFSNDHKRLTIAHELGHIIMHLSVILVPETRNKEEEAFKFAAEFLMPESEIQNSLKNMKLSYLTPLKQYWLTSMASIIRRAYDLKCIDQKKYKYFYIELGRLGYRKNEPVEVEIDKPSIFYEAYNLFKTELGYTSEELSKAFMLPIDVIRQFCERTSLHRLRIIKNNI